MLTNELAGYMASALCADVLKAADLFKPPPSSPLRMSRHIQPGHFAPRENAGHVQVGDGKALADQILAPSQSIVEDP
jgi:hypothetical protein